MKFFWLFGATTLAQASAASICPTIDWSSKGAGETWESSIDGVDGTHGFSLPDNYSPGVEMPLIAYFHGWGGGIGGGGGLCRQANQRVYACIRLQGMAGTGERTSWNGFGSTESGLYGGNSTNPFPDGTVSDFDSCPAGSEDEAGRTCNINPYGDYCYSSCEEGSNTCADDCWWTTCKDSVLQTANVLGCFMENFDVDQNRIFATGCSNGGMFLFELATSQQFGPKLAAIAPQVGLPHYGFNFGPVSRNDGTVYNDISVFALWGTRDGTVPPSVGPSSSGCTLDCRTSESNGWFYTSSECTTAKWADVLGLTVQGNYDDGQSRTDCEVYSSPSSNVEVVGCLFNGGHTCNMRFQIEPILDFFDTHGKPAAPGVTPAPSTSSAPSTSHSPISSQSGCQDDSECDNSLFCSSEVCDGGICVTGVDPCPTGETCDEALDSCICESCICKKRKECDAPSCTWVQGSCEDL